MATQASLCCSQGCCLSYCSKKNGRWGLYLLSPTVDSQPHCFLPFAALQDWHCSQPILKAWGMPGPGPCLQGSGQPLCPLCRRRLSSEQRSCSCCSYTGRSRRTFVRSLNRESTFSLEGCDRDLLLTDCVSWWAPSCNYRG